MRKVEQRLDPVTGEVERRCRYCREWWPLAAYRPNPGCRDGHVLECNACRQERRGFTARQRATVALLQPPRAPEQSLTRKGVAVARHMLPWGPSDAEAVDRAVRVWAQAGARLRRGRGKVDWVVI